MIGKPAKPKQIMTKKSSSLAVFLCVLLITSTVAQEDDEKSLPPRIVEEIGNCNLLIEDKDKEICPDDISGRCMNEKALYYTNILRACKRKQTGKDEIKQLTAGTMAMLQNAMQHTKTQAAKEDIFHQDIATVKFGPAECQDDLSGENVAMHWKPFFAKNPAWYCVMNQWLRSDGHRENMMRPEFKTGVIGIIQGKDGRQTCTQTFLSHEPKLGSDPECKSSAFDGSGQTDTTIPEEPQKSLEEPHLDSEKKGKNPEKSGNSDLPTHTDKHKMHMDTPSEVNNMDSEPEKKNSPPSKNHSHKHSNEFVIKTKSGKKIAFVEVIHKDICIKETVENNHKHHPLCFGPFFSEILKEFLRDNNSN